MTESIATLSNQVLRHEIRDLVVDYDEVAEPVHQLLAGEPGLSFSEQRSRAVQVKEILADLPETPEFVQAVKATDDLIALIDYRQAKHDEQFSPQVRLEQAMAAVVAAKKAYIAAEKAYTTAVATAAEIENEVLETEAQSG